MHEQEVANLFARIYLLQLLGRHAGDQDVEGVVAQEATHRVRTTMLVLLYQDLDAVIFGEARRQAAIEPDQLVRAVRYGRVQNTAIKIPQID